MASPPPDPQIILRGSVYDLSFVFFLRSFPHLLLAADTNGSIAFWNLQTKRIVLNQEKCHEATITMIIESHTNKKGQVILYSQSKDNTIKRWKFSCSETHYLKFSPSYQLTYDALTFCNFAILTGTPETKWLVAIPSVQDPHYIDTWNIKTTNKRHSFIPSEDLGMVMSLNLVLFDSLLLILAAFEDGSLSVWDEAKNICLCHYQFFTTPIFCFAITTRNHAIRGILGCSEDYLQPFSIVYNDQSEIIVKKRKPIPITNKGINRIQIRSDQKIFASIGWDSAVRIFNFKTYKPLAVLKINRQQEVSSNTLAFLEIDKYNPSNDHFLASTFANRIYIWNIY